MIGSDIATELVTSVIYDGLRKPFRGLQIEVARRQEIAKAFSEDFTSAAPESVKKTEAALNDLRKYLANGEGIYTERVCEFLTELRRSSVLDALFQVALVGGSADRSFPAFNLIYKSFEPLPFDARACFRALFAAIKARVDLASSDPTMLEVIRAVSQDLKIAIGELQSAFTRAKALTDPLDSQTFSDVRLRLAKSIENENREITVETDRGPKRIPISRLVVPARLHPTSASDLDIAAAPKKSDEYTTGLVDFRRGFRRAAILGDPGGGKSTASQYLCYDLAKQVSLATTNAAVRVFDPKDVRLPLKVVIRTLDKRQQTNPSYSIFEFLVDEIRSAVEHDTELAHRFLLQALTLGHAIVLFDGLDEILDIARRRQMVVQIEQFCHTYAASPVLVTSRIVGYRDAPLSDDFDIYLLARFNPEEVLRFSTNLISVIRRITKKAAGELAEDFLRQTENIATDLRQNPLMLGLMVYLFVEKGAVPDNRPEIYKQCSHLMFEKWDQHRGIKFPLPPNFELMDAFGHVASRIFGNSEAEDGVEKQWLVNEVRSYFEDWYGDKPRAVGAANVLVDFITGRAWVMCDVGPNTYKFTHRTFLEYFVARRMESESDSVSDLISVLYPRIVRAEWDVVCHLALQIATQSGPKATRALDALVSVLSDSQIGVQERVNLLHFVASAAEYLAVPEPKLAELARVVLDGAMKVSDSNSDAALSIVGVLFRSVRKREQVAKTILIEIVSDYLSQSGTAKRFAWYLLGARGVTIRGTYGARIVPAGGQVTDQVWSLLRDLRQSYEPSLKRLATKDVEAARAYWFVYNDFDPAFYEAHGSDMFFTRTHEGAPSSFRAMPYNALVWAIHSVEDPRDKSIAVTSARAAIGALVGEALGKGISLPEPYMSAFSGYRARDYLEYAFRRTMNVATRASHITPGKMTPAAEMMVAIMIFAEAEDRLLGPSETVGYPKRVPRRTCLNVFPGVRDRPWFGRVFGDAPLGPVIKDWLDGKINFIR